MTTDIAAELHSNLEEVSFPQSPIEPSNSESLLQKKIDRIVISVLVLLTGVVFAIGAVPTRIYGHDMFPALEAGWRVVCGQFPHHDFFTGLGPIVPFLLAAGIKLAHKTAAGVGYASAIMGLTFSIWAYFISRRQFPPVYAATLAIYTFLLTSVPIPLGEPSAFALSHANYYTRWSFGLLAIVLVECLSDERFDFWSGVSTGSACAALLFIKLNMFFICVGLIVPSLVWHPKMRRTKGLAIGAFAVTLLSLFLVRFDLVALWRDYAIIARAKAGSVGIITIGDLATEYIADFLLLLFIALPIAVSEKSPKGKPRGYLLAMALVVFLGGLLSLSTNWQKSEMPLNAIFAIAIFLKLNLFGEKPQVSSLKRQLLAVPAAIALLVITTPFMKQAKGLITSVQFKFSENEVPPAYFATPSLSGYRVFGGAVGRPIDGKYLVNKVNDGVGLLNEHTQMSESVATLELFNPFNFAQGRTPNIGGADFMAFGYNFNDTFKPSSEKLIGTADIVMVPKHPNLEKESFISLMRNYEPYLREHFTVQGESEQWTLWRKKR